MPAGNKKPTVKADIRNNRLIFTFSGWIRKKDLDSLYTDVRFCVADLKPGFHIITDLSECTFGSLNGLSTFRKIMAFLMDKQPGQVIRITRKSSLIHKQIINLSARFQGYKPIYVTSMAEALQTVENTSENNCLSYSLHRVPISFSGEKVQETGMLVELSEIGCTVECFSQALAIDQHLTLSFSLTPQNKPAEEFSLSGIVTTVDEDVFSVSFPDISQHDKERLRNALIKEAQKENRHDPTQQ